MICVVRGKGNFDMDEDKLRRTMCRVLAPFAKSFGIELDEAVNIVWLIGSVQKVHPKLWRKRIVWDFLDWARSGKRSGRPDAKNFEKKLAVFHPLGLTSVDENGKEYEKIGCIDKSSNKVDNEDEIDKVLLGCNRKEKLCLKLYFIAGFDMKETGKVVGVSESRVSQLIKGAIERIQDDYRISDQ